MAAAVFAIAQRRQSRGVSAPMSGKLRIAGLEMLTRSSNPVWEKRCSPLKSKHRARIRCSVRPVRRPLLESCAVAHTLSRLARLLLRLQAWIDVGAKDVLPINCFVKFRAVQTDASSFVRRLGAKRPSERWIPFQVRGRNDRSARPRGTPAPPPHPPPPPPPPPPGAQFVSFRYPVHHSFFPLPRSAFGRDGNLI